MNSRKLRLIYTAVAIDDLIRLRKFIAEHDRNAAHRLGAELVKRIDALRSFPQMGKIVEAAPDPQSIRDMAFGHYVVRYALHASTLAVLRVWHHFEQRG